jgi:hypothetical protein
MFGHTALFHRICEVYSFVRPTLQLGVIDLFRKLLPLFSDLEPVRFIPEAGLQRALPTIIRILTMAFGRAHHFFAFSPRSTSRRMASGGLRWRP